MPNNSEPTGASNDGRLEIPGRLGEACNQPPLASNLVAEPTVSEERAVRTNPGGAAAIIKRQQAEIERLRAEVLKLESHIVDVYNAQEATQVETTAQSEPCTYELNDGSICGHRCAVSETSVEPASVLAWAVRSFGPIALNRDERAARMAEEAVEVAQVEGVPLDVMQRITARVYSRPVGELGQEVGGLMVGLYALAARAGVDIEAEFKREFTRVLSKPADWWARKHAEKVAAGTADLTPVKTSGDCA